MAGTAYHMEALRKARVIERKTEAVRKLKESMGQVDSDFLESLISNLIKFMISFQSSQYILQIQIKVLQQINCFCDFFSPSLVKKLLKKNYCMQSVTISFRLPPYFLYFYHDTSMCAQHLIYLSCTLSDLSCVSYKRPAIVHLVKLISNLDSVVLMIDYAYNMLP